MTTRFAYVTAALLALGLTIAACGADAEPDMATSQAATQPPTPGPQPLATSPQTPTPSPQPAVDLPDLGPAPDFANEVWLNADRPLNLASLQGQVVLVEFWTFG